MKRVLFLIVILLFAIPCFGEEWQEARLGQAMMGGRNAPAGGTPQEFGYHPAGTPANYINMSNSLIGCKFTTPSAGSANPGSLYIYAAGFSVKGYICGVYSDVAGTWTGGTLLADIGEQHVSNNWPGGWAGPFSITWTGILNATDYWIVCIGEAGDEAYVYYDTGAALARSWTYDGTLPSTGPGSLDVGGYKIAVYITYTGN